MEKLELLKKVRAVIAAEPRRLDMKEWGRKGLSYSHDCQTVACIAGWITLLNEGERPEDWLPALTTEGSITQFVYGKYHMNIADHAARLIGSWDSTYPFLNIDWEVKDVLAWLDREIWARKGDEYAGT